MDEHSGMVALLVSSFIPSDVYGYCFTFFYSLSGDEEAQLRVKTRSDSGTNILWSLTGDQGLEWLYGQVCIWRESDHLSTQVLFLIWNICMFSHILEE